MKKTRLVLIVSLLVVAAMAAHAQQGGFRGPSAGHISVAEAQYLWDESPVILRGNLILSLGNERYLLSDGTGAITVEIKRRVWGTLSIDENDLVEISGEIDRNKHRVEVEVDTIRRL